MRPLRRRLTPSAAPEEYQPQNPFGNLEELQRRDQDLRQHLATAPLEYEAMNLESQIQPIEDYQAREAQGTLPGFLPKSGFLGANDYFAHQNKKSKLIGVQQALKGLRKSGGY